MLRISTVPSKRDTVRLRLEGAVSGPWVAELDRACEPWLGDGHALQLEVAEVSYLDQEGLELFANLRARGVVLIDCSPFLIEQLKNGAGSTNPNQKMPKNSRIPITKPRKSQ